MRLTRLQRKLCLLSVRLSELVDSKKISESNTDYRFEKCVISRAGIDRWWENRATINRAAESFIRAVFPLAAALPEPLCADEVGVFSFGRALGFEDERIRYIIDHSFARRIATYRSLIQLRERATEFTRKLGGLYHLYRLEDGSRLSPPVPGLVVIKCAASIRYPLPYRGREARRSVEERVRCKIVVPSYGLASVDALYKYDGYVSPTGGNASLLHWLLELRGGGDGPGLGLDLLLMYTEVPTAGGPFAVHHAPGVMLTQCQEATQYPTLFHMLLVRDARYEVAESRTWAGTETGAHRFNNYFYLRDRHTGLPVNERTFMREQIGVVFSRTKMLDRHGVERRPSETDRQAFEYLRNNRWSKSRVAGYR